MTRPSVQTGKPRLRESAAEVGLEPGSGSSGRELLSSPHPQVTMRRSRPGLSLGQVTVR